MKILLSPSKTAEYQEHPLLKKTEWLFPKQTKRLVAVIRKLNKTALGKALSIKGDLLTQTYQSYKTFHQAESYPAFSSFNGLVYKQLNVSEYTPEEMAYVIQHVRILDALYGVLEPTTHIKPYRLDMKAKLGLNLYSYWDIQSAVMDECIINLASNEFSQMIKQPMITIQFLEQQGNTYKNQATYAKMARGRMLDYMIRHQVKTIEALKAFNLEGYTYNEALSDSQTITFTR